MHSQGMRIQSQTTDIHSQSIYIHSQSTQSHPQSIETTITHHPSHITHHAAARNTPSKFGSGSQAPDPGVAPGSKLAAARQGVTVSGPPTF